MFIHSSISFESQTHLDDRMVSIYISLIKVDVLVSFHNGTTYYHQHQAPTFGAVPELSSTNMTTYSPVFHVPMVYLVPPVLPIPYPFDQGAQKSGSDSPRLITFPRGVTLLATTALNVACTHLHNYPAKMFKALSPKIREKILSNLSSPEGFNYHVSNLVLGNCKDALLTIDRKPMCWIVEPRYS